MNMIKMAAFSAGNLNMIKMAALSAGKSTEDCKFQKKVAM